MVAGTLRKMWACMNWWQSGGTNPAEHLSTLRARHHVTSSVLLHNTKHNNVCISKDTTTQHNIMSFCLHVPVSSNRWINKYLYSGEAVRAGLAIADFPVLTQTVRHSELQCVATVSALQELLPLLTASAIVVPQSHYPLWNTHSNTEHRFRDTSASTQTGMNVCSQAWRAAGHKTTASLL